MAKKNKDANVDATLVAFEDFKSKWDVRIHKTEERNDILYVTLDVRAKADPIFLDVVLSEIKLVKDDLLQYECAINSLVIENEIMELTEALMDSIKTNVVPYVALSIIERASKSALKEAELNGN